MAVLNFPSNPNPGDTYTIGSNTWIWNGTAWVKFNDPNKIFGNITATSVVITTTTNSTSTTSGALQVAGGVGIGGDLYVGGTFYVGGEVVLTTASFAYSLQEGADIKIELSSSTGALVFSNISTLQSVTSRGATTTNIVTFANTTQSTSTTTGAVVITGGLGVGKRINCESLKIADAIFDSTATSINMNSTYVIDSYDISDFRAAEYLIQIDEGTGLSAQYQMDKILLIANNTGTIGFTQYGTVSTNGSMGDFTATIAGGVVSLQFTPIFATDKTISVLRTAIVS